MRTVFYIQLPKNNSLEKLVINLSFRMSTSFYGKLKWFVDFSCRTISCLQFLLINFLVIIVTIYLHIRECGDIHHPPALVAWLLEDCVARHRTRPSSSWRCYPKAVKLVHHAHKDYNKDERNAHQSWHRALSARIFSDIFRSLSIISLVWSGDISVGPWKLLISSPSKDARDRLRGDQIQVVSGDPQRMHDKSLSFGINSKSGKAVLVHYLECHATISIRHSRKVSQGI